MIWMILYSCTTTEPNLAEYSPITDEPTKQKNAQTKRPNVVLVLIDTLRVDHLTSEIAPNLNVMATRSRRYTNTWSTSSWTAPASASVATGLLPIEHSVYRGLVASAELGGQTIEINTLPKDIPTLAEKLQKNGYHTYGLASNVNIDSAIGFDRGFEEFLCAPEEDAHVLFQKMEQWEIKEPYFLYLHLNDIHAPYVPRKPWYTPQKNRHEDMIAAYDSEISYLDNELAKLYQKMNWEENVLLITSDHGEEFLDHGQYGHLETLYSELTHVIFWLAGPGIIPRSVEIPISLADTHHILLHALDIAPPQPPTPILSHRVGKEKEIWSITDSDWRWVHGALYRTSDTKEQVNLAQKHPDLLQKYETIRNTILKEKGRRTSSFSTLSLEDDHVHLLKELGYVE
jgi:arylsulfatase A-like enzyme